MNPDSASPRAALRRDLLARRAAAPPAAAAGLAAQVAAWLAQARPASLGFYWPYRGEPDLRATVSGWLAAPGPVRAAALPVIEDGRMAFRRWAPGAAMSEGAYGIAVPAHGEWLLPEVLLIPCVGFDATAYRLGYGGGWYDRTLAALAPRPLTVGVALECTRLASIAPEPHDIPLDAVITEAGVFPRAGSREA